MPSTPFVYPQVVSRRFTLFRVVKSGVFPVHTAFWAWFDSRQLHRKVAAEQAGEFSCGAACAGLFVEWSVQRP